MSQSPHRQSLLLPVVIPLGALAVIGTVLFGFSRIMLGASHNAATVTACVVAATIMVVAFVVARQRRVGPSAIGSMLGVVAGVALMTGSLAFLIVGPQKEPVEATDVTLVAGPKASTDGFDQTSLSFPADTPVNLDFDNQESGVEHDVVIFQEDPAKNTGQTPLFTGALVTGPAKTTYRVPVLGEGSYFFHCEVHPATMTGTIKVTPGGAAPGPTIVAKELAFDTDTIDLAEETPTAITFDNEDPGTQHNIGIYTDDTLAESLFKGDVITGPATTTYTVPPLKAGSYYFHCDVHPTMKGTVEVKPGAGGGGGGGGGGDGGGGDGEGGPSPTASAPPETASPAGGGGDPAEASITAAGLAFNTTSLSFPADTPVALTMDNQDPGTPHNVAIYQDEAYTQPLFQGDLVTGPTTVTYDVPSLAAGTYYFRCDTHVTMAGTVSVT
jgi:plastocyanin